MHPNHELAIEVAKHLPGWSVTSKAEGFWAAVTMNAPDASGMTAECHISVSGKRFCASMLWPNKDKWGNTHSFYSNVTDIPATDSATVDQARGPEALAKAILTRMVPGCRERWAACLKIIAEHTEYIEAGLRTVAALESAGLATRRSETDNVVSCLHRGGVTLHSYGDNWREYVTVRVSGNSVTFDRFTVASNVATDVITACKKEKE